METLRPLPILTHDGSLPTGADLEALKAAKLSLGYEGLVLPARAVQGSPGPILAVGVTPDWLTEFAYVKDWSSVTLLADALRTVLISPERAMGDTYLLSKWLKGPVTFLGEEEFHEAEFADR